MSDRKIASRCAPPTDQAIDSSSLEVMISVEEINELLLLRHDLPDQLIVGKVVGRKGDSEDVCM